eukprot:COSAG02_NODE_505_length_20935_cov_38.509119_7_plen_62_part_00
MKTILLMRGSSSVQSFAAGPKLIDSCTPWKTNLVLPWPWIERTPLLRYRSLERSRRSVPMK